MNLPLTRIADKFIKVYIAESARESAIAQRCLDVFPSSKIEMIAGPPPSLSKGELTADEYTRSKRILYVTPHPGQFFKRCPGAKKGLACCNYFVLNLGQQCDMDCSYCYLQSFINTPYTMIYSNIDTAMEELATMYRDHGSVKVRIGTGEVIDSLSLDPLTLYSRQLIEFFRDKPNWNLEFKTKSNYVDQFLDVEHSGNTIVSWSINPQNIVETEEHGTASLKERLEAARRCKERGHQVAFHIDPVVWHPEWQTNYGGLVDEIATAFAPNELPYISLGALRFQPEQKDIMRERFGMKSHVNRAEMFRSSTGKMRYDRDLRESMFQFIIEAFKQQDPRWKIFLCMETPETWVKATGSLPYQQEEIRSLFKPLPL